MTKKLANRTYENDTPGPRFGTLFCHFFLKKFRFSLEGLVEVGPRSERPLKGIFQRNHPGRTTAQNIGHQYATAKTGANVRPGSSAVRLGELPPYLE